MTFGPPDSLYICKGFVPQKVSRLSSPGGFDDYCQFNTARTPPLVRIDDH
jgi:hypothetical protein